MDMEKDDRIRVTEAVVVEGKYDKIKLSSMIDGLIIVINGFGIYKDREKLALLRSLAKSRGLVVLTDSDSAGFQLRHFIGSAVPGDRIKNVYIPEVAGKERRKEHAGKEGMLGVEGMSTAVLKEAFTRAGIGCSKPVEAGERITKLELYELGLSGGPGSAEKRRELCRRLGLPQRLSSAALADVLTALVTREELARAMAATDNGD